MKVIDDLVNAGEIFKNDSNDELSRYKSLEFCYKKFQESVKIKKR